MKASIVSMGSNANVSNASLSKINLTLENLVNTEFDIYQNCVINSQNTLIDTITQLFIGSKKIRFGNYPSEQNVSFLKNIIQQNISLNKPIPIVVPMGPHKTIINENIDLAELYALKTLSALNSRVSKFYPQGLKIYLREEDITGWFLTGVTQVVKENIEKYLSDFEKLINILGYSDFIIPFRESSLVNYDDVVALIDVYTTPIRNYINDTNNNIDNYQNLTSYKVLQTLGWKGEIPLKQRSFYRERYKRNYPDKSMFEIDEMMINYLAISFAKSQFNALVPDSIKENFIQLTFAPPVPGIPHGLASRRLYYRTLPANISRMHLPFWRAKGFLSVSDDSINFAINNWDDKNKFYRHSIKLSSQNDFVILNADIASRTLN